MSKPRCCRQRHFLSFTRNRFQSRSMAAIVSSENIVSRQSREIARQVEGKLEIPCQPMLIRKAAMSQGKFPMLVGRVVRVEDERTRTFPAIFDGCRSHAWRRPVLDHAPAPFVPSFRNYPIIRWPCGKWRLSGREERGDEKLAAARHVGHRRRLTRGRYDSKLHSTDLCAGKNWQESAKHRCTSNRVPLELSIERR